MCVTGELRSCIFSHSFFCLPFSLFSLVVTHRLSSAEAILKSPQRLIEVPNKNRTRTNLESLSEDFKMRVRFYRKPKDRAEVVLGQFLGHDTEIKAIHRNPFFNKSFACFGSYTIRLWSEEIKEVPIFISSYQNIPITDGCWSPTRANVLFTSTLDGCITFWDLLYRQSAPVMTTKVSDVSELPLFRELHLCVSI